MIRITGEKALASAGAAGNVWIDTMRMECSACGEVEKCHTTDHTAIQRFEDKHIRATCTKESK